MTVSTIVHVGFQKTGSTWLQHLFEGSPGLFNVDRHTLIEHLIDPGRFAFNAEEAKAALLGAHRDQTVMASHEWLVGHPFGNGYDTQVLTERIQQVFGDCCKVLVVIRRQEDMIRAHYGEWVSHGGALSPRRFMAAPATWRWHPGFRFDYFEYDRVIAHYQAAFGIQNVVVVPYEQLRADPVGFVTTVGERLSLDLAMIESTPSHRSFSARTLRLLRQSNRVLSTWGHNPGAAVVSPGAHGRFTRSLRRIEARVPEGARRTLLDSDRTESIVAAEINGRFAASNRRTQSLAGLELGKLGYQV